MFWRGRTGKKEERTDKLIWADPECGIYAGKKVEREQMAIDSIL